MSYKLKTIATWRSILGYPFYDPNKRDRNTKTKYIRAAESWRKKRNCIPIEVSDWDNQDSKLVLHVQKSKNNKTYKLFIHLDETKKVRQGRRKKKKNNNKRCKVTQGYHQLAKELLQRV
tara:strand:+ start:192 stop:548 length:357 start_codon:yes stop_codon:yes gene_type:complete